MPGGWSGAASAPRWYCLLVALFLGVRAVSTLAAHPNFAVPGDGWRSVWQLAMVALLAAGTAGLLAAQAAAGVVGGVYATATALEAFHGTALFGVVPVDMRDRIVHPVLAGLALACIYVG